MAGPEKKINIPKPDDFLAEMRERAKEASEGLEHIHEQARKDLKMLLGEEQWDKEIREWREKMKKPCITQNLLPTFNKRVKNEQRKQRPQVQAIPVDDKADIKTANVVAGIIRNIWYQSKAHAVHDIAFDQMVDSSISAWRIKPEYEDLRRSRNQELRIRQIKNPLSVLWDLNCAEFDTADKKWAIIVEQMRKKDFEKQYPGKQSSIQGLPDGDPLAGWFMTEKVQRAEYWYIEEKKQKMLELSNGQVIEKQDEGIVRDVLAWIKRQFGEGVRVINEWTAPFPEIRSCICSGTEILEGPTAFPGSLIPIIIAYGEMLYVEGKMHLKSLHRDARESQPIHNYLVSALIESFAMQPNVPYIGSKTHFQGHEEQWKTANDGTAPYLVYNSDPNVPQSRPERQPPPQVSNALPMMIDLNQRNIRAVYGLFESDLGMRSNEKSGIAIEKKQEQGDTGTFVFVSNFDYALQLEGRILCDLIPSYYDAEKWQRIMGREGEHSLVKLNQTYSPQEGRKPVLYDVTAGKYDVIITTGPSSDSQRQEALQTVSQIIEPTMKANPPAASLLLAELVKLIDAPNNERLQKLIKATLPAELQKILDEEDMPGEGEDPKITAMQQEFEAKMAEALQQLQVAGATIEQLQAAVAEGERQKALWSEERDRMKADVDLAKREARVDEAEKRSGSAGNLNATIAQLSAVVQSMDAALAKYIQGGRGKQ